MNSLKLEEMSELMGKLRSLKDSSSIVDVEMMKLDHNSKRKLANVLLHGITTYEDQSLMLEEFMISRGGKAIVEEGQSLWLKRGNDYVFTNGINPTHFEAKLETLVPLGINPLNLVACEVVLGNITLDLSQCQVSDLEDDAVLYSKVPMMLYPHSNKSYSYRIIK